MQVIDMTENQQQRVLQLLKRAWGTVDYFDHNGDLSVEIKSLINEVEGNLDWPYSRDTS